MRRLWPAVAGADLLTVSPRQWDLMLAQAKILVESGLLPQTVNTPAKAAAIMLKGHELRIPPMYALSNIVIINGKPTTSAELMLALVYRDHGDSAIQFADTEPTACTIAYKRRGWAGALRFTFTLEEARRAGLTSNATWQKYPAAMLRARCISAVARLAFPDSIGGMYTPEELGAAVEVTDSGEVVVQQAPAQTVAGEPVAVFTGEIAGESREIPAEEQEREAIKAAYEADQATAAVQFDALAGAVADRQACYDRLAAVLAPLGMRDSKELAARIKERHPKHTIKTLPLAMLDAECEYWERVAADTQGAAA